MSFPDICVVDTNVPKVANLAIVPDPNSDIDLGCIQACVDAIEHVKKHCLVIDAGWEILNEYCDNLPKNSPSGVESSFIKWVFDHYEDSTAIQKVAIRNDDGSYKEFPKNPGLKNFDPSDRKFVAVANAHKDKPPILQATDSKWVGWKDSLAEEGIQVCFLCPKYIEAKYEKKKKV